MSNNENNLDLSTTLWPLPAHFVIDSNPWVEIIKYQIHDHPPHLTAKGGEFELISLSKIYIIIKIVHIPTWPAGAKKTKCLVTLSPSDLLSPHLCGTSLSARTEPLGARTEPPGLLASATSSQGGENSNPLTQGSWLYLTPTPAQKCTKKGEKSLQNY